MILKKKESNRMPKLWGLFLVLLSSYTAATETDNSTTTTRTTEDSKLDISALFSDMTPTDMAFLTLALVLILIILGFLVRTGARARQRLLQIRNAQRTYALQQIDIQSLPTTSGG